jgi:hypothetical protein
MDAMKPGGVGGDVVRVADLDIKPGVTSDEGDGDEWRWIGTPIDSDYIFQYLGRAVLQADRRRERFGW